MGGVELNNANRLKVMKANFNIDGKLISSNGERKDGETIRVGRTDGDRYFSMQNSPKEGTTLNSNPTQGAPNG